MNSRYQISRMSNNSTQYQLTICFRNLTSRQSTFMCMCANNLILSTPSLVHLFSIPLFSLKNGLLTQYMLISQRNMHCFWTVSILHMHPRKVTFAIYSYTHAVGSPVKSQTVLFAHMFFICRIQCTELPFSKYNNDECQPPNSRFRLRYIEEATTKPSLA